jgi:hypothetical protein
LKDFAAIAKIVVLFLVMALDASEHKQAKTFLAETLNDFAAAKRPASSGNAATPTASRTTPASQMRKSSLGDRCHIWILPVLSAVTNSAARD